MEATTLSSKNECSTLWAAFDGQISITMFCGSFSDHNCESNVPIRVTEPPHHVLENVRISRLLHTSPTGEWQIPRTGVEECDPPIPHDSLAIVQSEWGRALNPNALDE
jgi:hypothetical protein